MQRCLHRLNQDIICAGARLRHLPAQHALHPSHGGLERTQQALEESRTRYMRLYHDAPVGYVVLDTMGRVSETNASFANMVQRDRGRILGRPFGDFIHVDDRPIFFARSKAFFKNPAEKSIELRLNTREAANCHVSIQANRPDLPDEEFTPHHHDLLLTVTDITDRVVAEQALAESESFARSTVDALSANIAILDATGHIIAVNRAWREFSEKNGGRAETTGEGANYLALCQSIHGLETEEGRRFGAGILKVINGDLDFYTQEYACHSPKEQRWFVGRVTRFPGRGSKVVVAHENITERKHLETENLRLLHQVNQLEKEDSLNRMAGAIAHHYNNLLFVVLGNIELALEMDSDDPMVRQCLKHAQDGTNRMAEISGKMLTYLGLTVKDRAKIDLAAVCSQSLPLLRAMYPETVQVEAFFPEQGPDIVAHAPQIQELLHILVENARESCHDQQQCEIHLTISTATAESIAPSHRFPIGWTPQHTDFARLQITDNGSGIAQEHLERIFDPFFSNKFLGRGMGLSLVQGILRAHEGCVTVTSTPGEGTSINVYLPLANEDAAGPSVDTTT